MAGNNYNDPLAYGDYHGRAPTTEEEPTDGSERGMIGDTFRRLRGRYQSQQPQGQYHQDVSAPYSAVGWLGWTDKILSSPNTKAQVSLSHINPTHTKASPQTLPLFVQPTDPMEDQGPLTDLVPAFSIGYMG